MSLEQKIVSAEEKYLQILEEFFIEKWGNTLLFSHNISHHRRVWQYAKELIEKNKPENKNITLLFLQKLLISCYMHDLGMSVDPNVRHGIHSRELCKLFLHINNLSELNFVDVLDAVEYHDDKEYKTQEFNNNEILQLLMVADDLDAFGYIGIYRYLEIYIARNIRAEVIGDEIRQNALARFQNFELKYNKFPDLIAKHRIRFLILDDFFVRYNREAHS